MASGPGYVLRVEAQMFDGEDGGWVAVVMRQDMDGIYRQEMSGEAGGKVAARMMDPEWRPGE